MPLQSLSLACGLRRMVGWNRMDIECGIYDLVLGIFILVPFTIVVLACSPTIV
jgi:hypothetical protein